MPTPVVEGFGVCGCGKPVRYMVAGDESTGSCNKYKRCPTWDELHQENKALRARLAQHEQAMKQLRKLMQMEDA